MSDLHWIVTNSAGTSGATTFPQTHGLICEPWIHTEATHDRSHRPERLPEALIHLNCVGSSCSENWPIESNDSCRFSPEPINLMIVCVRKLNSEEHGRQHSSKFPNPFIIHAEQFGVFVGLPWRPCESFAKTLKNYDACKFARYKQFGRHSCNYTCMWRCNSRFCRSVPTEFLSHKILWVI